MQAVTYKFKDMPEKRYHSILTDRTRQFVDRLKWNLFVSPQGHETDEYDDEHSLYIAIFRNDTHLGSCRLRPVTKTTMLTDHFLDVFPGAIDFVKQQQGRVYELTRFCRNPEINASEGNEMLDQLALQLDRFRDCKKLTGFLAIVFPQVARFLDRIGVRYLVVFTSFVDGKQAFLICITHAMRPFMNEIFDSASIPSARASFRTYLCKAELDYDRV